MLTKKQFATKNRTQNFLLGLIVSLGFIFISFEYTTNETIEYDFPSEHEVFDYVEESIPVTTRKQKEMERQMKKPPKPILNIYKLTFDEFEIPEDEPEFDPIDESEPSLPEVIGNFKFDPNGEEKPDEDFFTVVEKMPEFPGGEAALMEFLSNKISYPTLAVEFGITGRVVVEFIVTKTGKIKNINVLKGVHESLDNEALRVVELMPNWIPGQQRGKNVAVKFILPVTFTLK